MQKYIMCAEIIIKHVFINIASVPVLRQDSLQPLSLQFLGTMEGNKVLIKVFMQLLSTQFSYALYLDAVEHCAISCFLV